MQRSTSNGRNRGIRTILVLGAALACNQADPSGPGSGTDAGTGTSTAEPSPECGNGLIEGDETCDNGSANGPLAACTPMCTLPECGDGFVHPNEACDPASDDGEPCTTDCQIERPEIWIDRWGGTAGLDDQGLALAIGAQGQVYVAGAIRDQELAHPWLRSYTADGTLRWERSFPETLCVGVGAVDVVAGRDGVFVSAVDCADAAVLSVRGLDRNGELRWETVLAEPPDEQPSRAYLATFEDRLGVAYIASTAGVPVRAVAGLNTLDGAVVATFDPGETLRDLVIAPDGAFVGVSTEKLVAYESDGGLRWERPLRSWKAALSIGPERDVLIVRNAKEPEVMGHRVERYDAEGALRWSTPLDIDGSGLAADAQGNTVVVGVAAATDGQVPTNEAAAMVGVDSEGSVAWESFHEGPAHAEDAAVAVAMVDDGDYVVTGRESVALAGDDVWVARFDPLAARGTNRTMDARRPRLDPTATIRRERAAVSGPDTIYVELGGRPLSRGTSSAADEAACLLDPVDFPAYLGSHVAAEEALGVARTLLEPFAVRVVTERPPDYLPYTMVVVGGLADAFGLDRSVRGLACSVDCRGAVRRDTVFVFGEAAAEPAELGRTIVHEAAHSWGLDHVDGDFNVMNPVASGTRAELSDECVALSHVDDAPHCSEDHAEHCPPDQQNAVAELIETLGPSGQADAPPDVTHTSPDASAELVAGVETTWAVDVTDDHPGVGWRFSIPELQWSHSALDAEKTLDVILPPGELTLTVEAMDQAGQKVVVEHPVTVLDPDDVADPSGTGTDPTDGSTASGCRAAPPSAFPLLVLLPLARRVRRRRPAPRSRRLRRVERRDHRTSGRLTPSQQR